MITIFQLYNEAKTSAWYKGFEYKRNPDKKQGEYGLWYIPELYYRNFANKIEKGFETVSMIQCREAIDQWYNFNLKTKKYKENENY